MTREAITILHLSDPQFGRNHVFGKRALPLTDGKHDTLLARTCDDLDLLAQEWDLKPDIVVLTGDLAEWGLKEELKHCFDFLAGIGMYLGIRPDQRNRIAVIPGNHDINRDLAAAECSNWRAKGKKGEPFGFGRFEFFAKAFRNFYKKVPDGKHELGNSFTVPLRPGFSRMVQHSLFIVPELNVVLAGLNSVLAECDLETADAKTQFGSETIYGHHGYCGEAQYKHFARKLEPFDEGEWLRIGLVHHNVVRGATSDDENLTDVEQLKQHLGQTLHLLLHGHTHIADRALLPNGQPILSTGSASLSSGQRPHETPNQYQVLRITAEGIEAWMRAFDHHRRCWIPDGRVGGEKTPGRLSVRYSFLKATKALQSALESAFNTTDAKEAVTADPKEQLRRFDDEMRSERNHVSDAVEVAATRIAELRWPSATIDWYRTSPLYFSVVTNESFGFRSFAVGLLLSPIQVSDQIQSFDSLTTNATWERWLVVAPTVALIEPFQELPPTWDIWKKDCSSRGIRLLSWRDFERMSDLRIAIDTQKNELLGSKDYPEGLYVAQRMELYTSLEPGKSADPVQPVEVVEDAFAELKQRVTTEGPNFILVDGSFGTGKTFLLRRLALAFSEQGSPVIPLLIELRSLDKVLRAEDMLVTRLNRLGQQRIEPAQLAYMAEAGHLLILFDGYDELALRVNFDRAADHLSTITAAARGKATVVLTCRTQHFESDNQMVMNLMQQEGLVRVRLLPFSEPQIEQFLKRKLGDPKAAAQRLALIHDIKDLLGLSENPRMLSFIADLPEEDLKIAKAAAPDGKISAAGLYEKIIDRWLRNEVLRRSHKQQKDAVAGQSGYPSTVSDERYLAELWEAVTHLAFLAWGRMERPFETHEIQQTLADVSSKLLDVTLSPEERTQGIASGSLLSREGAGKFAFAHYSIPEFLVARDIARQYAENPAKPPIVTGQSAQRSFTKEAITDLMCEFLIDELTWTPAARWAVDIATAPRDNRPSKHALPNGMRMIDAVLKRGTKIPSESKNEVSRQLVAISESLRGTSYDGEDLRGKVFTGSVSNATFVRCDLRLARFRDCDLTSADFSNSNLADADLSSSTLSEALFRNTNLTGANLAHVDLRCADLTSADLTRATLIAADLRGAVLTNSQWAMARLTGATLDDPQLTGLSAPGAGLPRIPPLPMLLPGASDALSVAWSPSGALVATGHENGSAILWDSSSGQCLRTLRGHQDSIRSVAFSPDGSRLASGSYDKTLRVWDLSSGQCLHVLKEHSSAVSSVAFSPDGSRFASGSYDSTLRVWDSSRGQCVRTLEGHQNWVSSVAFSPDGNRLASGSFDNTLRVWDSSRGHCLRTLEGHQNWVSSVAFSPDGSRLASGSYDTTLRVWDSSSGHCLRTLEGHQNWVSSVAFSPGGSRLASGSSDTTLRVWDSSSGRCLHALAGHSSAVRSVAFSPDGSRLASGSDDKTSRVWDSSRGQCLRTLEGHQDWVSSVAFSPYGRRLASGSSDKTLRVWDLSRGQCLRTLEGHSSAVSSVAFSPDGSRLASGSSDKTLRVWDSSSGHCLRTLDGHQNWVSSVAFSPGGSRLASGSSDTTLRVWDLSSGQCLHSLKEHSSAVRSVAFSPDGRRLASGSNDETLRVWDWSRGQCVRTLEGHQNWVSSVAFSPDSSRLASGSFDTTLRVWDSSSGQCLRTMAGHSSAVMSVAFSPDGSRLASGSSDKTLRVWDSASGECLRTLKGHSSAVTSVAFWSRGPGSSALLVSSSQGGTVRIWNPDTGDCVGILLAHGDGWAALRPDGRYRAVGDMSRYLWHISGLARYELGELDDACPELKLAPAEPLIPPVYFR